MSFQPAERITLLSWRTVQMRTFHLTWMAFFLCFFGWFGLAPLMPVVRQDLGLTKGQVGTAVIASVAVTVLVRVVIGPLCDRFGPRRVYSLLLVGGALPVMAVGLAESFETFLLGRLMIGAVGASFVVTQYHTSVMFAPRVVGTANATTAGWGNLGGGVTQIVMPLVLAAIVSLGVEPALGWRWAMVVPGGLMLVMALLYWRYTADGPRRVGVSGQGTLLLAARDRRVWALFVVYAGCFGVELTINNIAALYYFDRFALDLSTAGLLAGLFGLMNLFARSLGGILSDRFAGRGGLRGRVWFLFAVMLLQGVALVAFAQMDSLIAAVAVMVVFSLFVQMSEGATFGVVPFINRRALGAVSGIVGAGGNAGAVAAGFLFKSEALTTQQGLFWLGLAVIVTAFAALVVHPSAAMTDQKRERGT
jgi:NNP family nitrate/nitrite transporter-like MFS transporter